MSEGNRCRKPCRSPWRCSPVEYLQSAPGWGRGPLTQRPACCGTAPTSIECNRVDQIHCAGFPGLRPYGQAAGDVVKDEQRAGRAGQSLLIGQVQFVGDALAHGNAGIAESQFIEPQSRGELAPELAGRKSQSG